MNTVNTRGNLNNFRRGIKEKSLKIGFAGGSITTASNRENWPTHLRGWLLGEFSDVKFRFNNAAIGATGSLCGLALAQREFIDSEYDLVFVEYAVNDNAIDSDERMRTREGLIRKLLSAGIDVVLVYTYFSEMYDPEHPDKLPQSIAELEQLAEHYCISSVYMAQAVYRMAEQGRCPWNMWLPDGTHPQAFGSYIYASAVIKLLKEELLCEDSVNKKPLPVPINANNWENAVEYSLDDVRCNGAWSIEKERELSWFDEKLYSCALKASLSFSFHGRGAAIIFNYGRTSGLIEYRIDNSEWKELAFKREWWVPEENFVNAVKCADDLNNGEHLFELRVSYVNKKDFTSSMCSILKIITV